jgi:Cellulose biosynthesis protein BcsS
MVGPQVGVLFGFFVGNREHFNMRFSIAFLAFFVFIGVFDAGFASAAEDEDNDQTQAFTSYTEADATAGAYFLSSELYAVLNGDNSRSGPLLHIYFGGGQYDYDSEFLKRNVDVVALEGDALLGYQWVTKNDATLIILLGLGIEDNELDINDRSNPIRGFAAGFKIDVEFEADDEKPFYYNIEGNYTTAFQTYWSRVRLGYPLGHLMHLGPEAEFFGDQTFNSQRIGGFLRFPIRFSPRLQPIAVLAAGYAFEESVGSSNFGGIGGTGDSPFGTASLEFDF